MTISIAIVETEEMIQNTLALFLKAKGFEVIKLNSGAQLYKYMVAKIPDIVILDALLPDEDGLNITYYLRNHLNDIGIIFSSIFNHTEDRIKSMEAGADAYLSKPINMKECECLIHRILSRSNKYIDGYIKNNKEYLLLDHLSTTPIKLKTHLHWAIETQTFSLIAPNGHATRLTSGEYQLLTLLFDSEMCLISKADILKANQLDQHDWHCIENCLGRLRKKVRSELKMVLPIRSVFGKGLVFAAQGRVF